MKRLLWLAALGLLSAHAWAEPLAAPVKTEVNQLLTRLEVSGCKFERNGSLHSGAEAKAHLLSKLSYLERNERVTNTERFIELAATKSSSSGQAYRVVCPGQAAVASQQWLLTQLKAMRSSGQEPSAPAR